ncbi:hypothetical protein [Amphibacillus indicireducens]|uniref:V-type ATPase subunit E n=1 Tax=Amphibacillus indicireducens TaxID=1076330 RepID=A0ABP7VLV4_9BACI
MEDISVLSVQILSRTKKQGQSKLEAYQKVADDKLEETSKKLEESEKRQKDLIIQQLNNDYERQIQTMKNKQRNQILAKKQELLNTVFDQAVTELENWDETQFSQFLSGVLSKIDPNKEWSIVSGERSVKLMQSNQVKTVLSHYSFVTVSDQTVNNKAGFILEQGGIDYNFCFDVLINELKKDFSPQLATLAF